MGAGASSASSPAASGKRPQLLRPASTAKLRRSWGGERSAPGAGEGSYSPTVRPSDSDDSVPQELDRVAAEAADAVFESGRAGRKSEDGVLAAVNSICCLGEERWDLTGVGVLDSAGARLAADLLPSRLLELNLSWNVVTGEGLAVVAKCLARDSGSSLQSLLLAGCAVEGDAGTVPALMSLASALNEGSCPHLRELDLSCNGLQGLAAGQCFSAVVMPLRRSLEVMGFWGNKLGAEGGSVVAHSLFESGPGSTLRVLDLSDNALVSGADNGQTVVSIVEAVSFGDGHNQMETLVLINNDLAHSRPEGTVRDALADVRDRKPCLNVVCELADADGGFDATAAVQYCEGMLSSISRRHGPSHVASAAAHARVAQILRGSAKGGRKRKRDLLAAWDHSSSSLRALSGSIGFHSTHVASVLEAMADVAAQLGLAQPAEELLRRSLAVNQEHLGEHAPAVASTCVRLARVILKGAGASRLHVCGDVVQSPRAGGTGISIDVAYRDARIDSAASRDDRHLSQETRDGRYSSDDPRGDRHLSTCRDGRNSSAAWSVASGGKEESAEEALSLYLKALAIREEALGHCHPLVAKTLYPIALLLLHWFGSFVRAEELLQRALSICAGGCENCVGRGVDDDRAPPSGALSLGFRSDVLALLGTAMWSQDRRSEAVNALRRALESKEAFLGSPTHVDLGSNLESLAVLLYHQHRQKLKDAHAVSTEEDARRRAEEQKREREAMSRGSLSVGEERVRARTEALPGDTDLAEASALYRRAVAIREVQLGAHHKTVVQMRRRMKKYYPLTGQDNDAKVGSGDLSSSKHGAAATAARFAKAEFRASLH